MMQQEQNESTPTTETVTEKTRGTNLTTKTTPMSTKQMKALVNKTRQKRADGLNSVFQLGTVSGKEYAKFMKLVKAKLKELGVKDMVTWERTQKIITRYEPTSEPLKDKDGNVVKDKDGKDVMSSTVRPVKYVRAMARNMNKSLAKQFCSMSRQEIEQFLETDVEEFKKAAEARKAEMAAEQQIITRSDPTETATPESPTNE